MNLEKALKIQNKVSEYYKSIKFINLFKKYPKKVNGLKFGYICPGAMKTIEYLNKHVNMNSNKEYKKTVSRIKLLTDYQFFIEIIVIYKDYIDEDIYRISKSILKNKSCDISKIITKEITELFGFLPPKIKENLPDNFYHIRHDTLICSKNKNLANERIDLLQSIYGAPDSLSEDFSGCNGCCIHYFKNNKKKCMGKCIDF
jgi:hypothetical protein